MADIPHPHGPVGDIIIPAHNEAAVIDRCLQTLNPQELGSQVRVIVACNGCTDDTAALARAHPVEVIELSTPSKTAAIRSAELQCRPVPRIYVDADVELAAESARSVLQHLADGCLAARPQIRYVTDDCAWSVRAYYRARQHIPSVMNRLWGAGVYGLSPQARARFGVFADVTAEDYWVDLHFAQQEICIVTDCPPVQVHVPRSAKDLRHTLRRVYGGPAAVRPESVASTERTTSGELKSYARRGGSEFLDATVYATYALGSRLPRASLDRPWNRDESSRGGAAS